MVIHKQPLSDLTMFYNHQQKENSHQPSLFSASHFSLKIIKKRKQNMFFHDQSSPRSLAPLQPAQKKIQNWFIRTSAALKPLAGSLFMSIMLAAETGSSKNHSTIISFGSTFWLIVFCPHQKELLQPKASGLTRKGFAGVGWEVGAMGVVDRVQLLPINS